MDTHRRRFGLLHLLFLALFLVGSSPLLGQEHLFRIMGYNVENLFDTEDDPTKDDNAFLPTGEQHWTKERYRTKLQHIAEVISAVGGDAFPDLIGLVEVENATVLQDLLQKTTLGANTSYRYLVSSGEDRRGIDVALLYDPRTFTLLSSEELPLTFPFDTEKKTRPILRASGRLLSGDTLHVFVCHLPSRRGGAWASERYRSWGCRLLREATEKLLTEGGCHTHCLLLGDFNGDPEEAPTARVLQSLPYRQGLEIESASSTQLYSLLHRETQQEPRGSYCYQGVWSQLDQIHLSVSLLRRGSRVRYVEGSAETVRRPFYSVVPASGGDPVPFRTYGGSFYRGGYSDHFPTRLLLSY